MKNSNFFTKYLNNEKTLLLGPMAGVTDLPFRLLCKEQGADIVCTEMVSAKAVLYKNKNTDLLMRTDEREAPLMLQLFGNDPEIMTEVALSLEDGPWEIFDINMGCPVPKVVNNGEGSALMKTPELAGKIVETMTGKLSKPVTVKFRKGFDEAHANAVEFAKRMEAAGASAVTVHGRTREQYYHGKADWDIIRQVKDAVKIPVIGNGDVTDADTFAKLRDETGCDAVMIARAATGNPWVFNEIKTGYKKSTAEVRELMLRHIELEMEFDGDYAGLREMRKHIAWYTHGLRGAGQFRDRINHIEQVDELKAAIDSFFEEL